MPHRPRKTPAASVPNAVHADTPWYTPEHLLDDAKRLALAAWAWLKGLGGRIWHALGHLSRTTQIILGAILVILLAIILFLAQPNWDWARGFVASMVSGRVHRPVKIDGHLRVHLFSFTPDAKLSGLKIGQPDWAGKATGGKNLADIGAITVQTKLMPLFIGKIVLPRLQVDQPVVTLYQDKNGQANWDFSNGADKGKPLVLPLIENFIINNGQITANLVQNHLTFSGTVNAHEKADASNSAFGVTGQGKLNNKVFQLVATGGPLLNVKSSVPYPFDMQVRAGDTHLTATGRILHPFNLGQLDAAVTVSGRDLYDLYYLTGLAMPNTGAFTVAASVNRNDRIYTIDRINGHIGSSDLGGKLKVDTSREHGRPDVTGDLYSRVLDFKDMGSLFGATNANAPTAPTVSMSPQAASAARRLLPDAPLDVQRVRGMDAKVHYRAQSVRASANMPLRAVSLGVTLDHGLLTLDPIDFTFPYGHLTGTASLDARKDVQQNVVDMRLVGIHVQDFLAKGANPPLEGTLDARVRATGAGSSVHTAASNANGQMTVVMPGGTLRQSLAELMGVDATKGLFLLLSKDKHETDIRCAVADFRINNGVMQAQSIVFDTGVVLVNGSGTVNLNNEALNLTFKGKPKKFRLVRVNAPILVGGHMAAPKFGISPGPAIAQGGLALVFHSIIPFLGFDTAKNANCAGLLADAQGKGAPIVGHKGTK